jgi:hypothetical protein
MAQQGRGAIRIRFFHVVSWPTELPEEQDEDA